jgi:DNA (cytosine-5)-methyltransferase 1
VGSGINPLGPTAAGQGPQAADCAADQFGETLSDEAGERSRATICDVPRFAEPYRYRAVIVENVVDAAR